MRENSIHLWPSIKPDFIDLYFKMRLPRVLARVIAFREWEGRRVGSEGRRGGGAGEWGYCMSGGTLEECWGWEEVIAGEQEGGAVGHTRPQDKVGK